MEQSRREFLKVIAGTGAMLVMPRFSPLSGMEARVYAPPSAMLHSRHWRVLPDLLKNLRDIGYEGITYRDWDLAMKGQAGLPAQPVILSVDDLSLEKANTAFKYFMRMKNNFLDANCKGVFSIITRPNQPHDENRWAEVKTWVDQGMELATHTAYHSILDNPKFTAEDYQREIGDSAALIEAKTRQPVLTLVTPFGSGYDVKTHTLNPHVLEAARQAKLRFIVGIATGYRHIHEDLSAGDVIYAGRANPGDENTVADVLYYFKYW